MALATESPVYDGLESAWLHSATLGSWREALCLLMHVLCKGCLGNSQGDMGGKAKSSPRQLQLTDGSFHSVLPAALPVPARQLHSLRLWNTLSIMSSLTL